MKSLDAELRHRALAELAGPIAPQTAALPATARWVLRLLERFPHGTLLLTLPDGQCVRLGAGRPFADLRLADWSVLEAVLKSGDIGFAESYAAGQWASSGPVRLLRYFVRNRAQAEALIHGSFWGSLAYRVRHWLNRNTRTQAKRNISAHYDLGNDFYALWLDPSMTYSSALFDECGAGELPTTANEATLAAAQQAKYARVLSQLQLRGGSRLLEIGCGWGGFAEHAVGAGHRVRGLTLSPAQLEYAQRRLRRAGGAHELVLQDYRDERGSFDGIASIEMFEAVGEAYWPSYFATLARCLRPGARACLQTITIDEALFARYRSGTDFIQQYIFPGGMLPSRSAFRAQAVRAGLQVVDEFAFGAHYARTLALWRTRFMGRLTEVGALGFDQRFVRLWEFYLAYCEAAFAEGNTNVVQFTLLKPAA